jgi:hypothetical protein
MDALARAIDEELNGDLKRDARAIGFCLIVFPFRKPRGTVNYISNAKREQIVELLEQQLEIFRKKKKVPS